MCGRYTLFKLADLLKLIPWLQAPAEILEREARYNVAPSQLMPIATERDGQARLRLARWGFVPSWAKGVPRSRPINARAETVSSSGMFRHAFHAQRCLVPADGFYEWKGSRAPKQPYYIRRRDGTSFMFAGLWSCWRPPEAEPVDTFTILTTSANELMAPIHNRMPVIVPADRYRDWLEGKDVDGILRSCPAQEIEALAVSARVNGPAFDCPECLEPADPAQVAPAGGRRKRAADASPAMPNLFGN